MISSGGFSAWEAAGQADRSVTRMTQDPQIEGVRPIDARGAQGVQVGDYNVQNVILWQATRAAGRQVLSALPYGLTSVHGRDDLLDELHGRIQAAQAAPRRDRPVRALLHGMPGVGKSAIAAEYARRFGAEYGLVWWVPTQDIAAAASAFTQLAGQLEVLGPGDQSDPVATVHAMLAVRPDRWLLIFDDAPDAEALDRLMPASPNGDVLVTSRNPGFGAPDVAMRVPELDVQAASEILAQRTNSTDLDSARRLANELGGLPLALMQAAAFVASSMGTVNLADYLRLVRQRQSEVLGEDIAAEYSPGRRTVAATFTLALSYLTAEATAMLRLLTCFEPHRVPVFILDYLSEPGAGDDPVARELWQALADPLVRSRAIAVLVRYSLVQPWDDQDPRPEDQEAPPGPARMPALSMHQLVRAIALGQVAAEELASWRRVARGLIDKATPRDPEDPSTWLRYDLLLPQIRATANAALAADDGTYWRAATFLERHGDSRTACLLWRDIEGAARAAYGGDDPRTLAAIGNLAVSLAGSGRLAEAAGLERQVLEGRRKVLGGSHPDTLTAMGNLAIRLAALGDLTAAADLERQVLDNLKARGDESASYRVMADLAATLAASGDLAGAVDLEKQVIDGRRRLFGNHHPYIFQAMINLAARLTMLGAAAEAITIVRPVVDELRKLRGQDHPDTLAAMSTLAVALTATGKITAAAQLQRQVLDGRRRTLGDSHPDTYYAMGNLAISLGALSHFDEAIDLERAVQSGFERLFGADHINTLTAMSNLAASLAASGDLKSAIELERRVLEGCRRTLGDGHPRTVRAARNVAKWQEHR
jgi:tetratricopeptide (TPR) repeat protein